MKTPHLPTFRYDQPAVALTQLLDWIEERIDPTHVAAVEERHIRALQWQPLDRPSITLSAPVAPPFVAYPYHEAFHDPTKMLINELVGPYAAIGPSPSIVNSVVLRDDYPLQIRAFYGVGLMASLFGGQSELVENHFPWVRPIGAEALKAVVAHGVPELRGGLFQRALDTMAYYKGVLASYPKCRRAVHITQPDLQGPFDIAAQLWSGAIFTAFYDCPDFLRELLDLVAETYIAACRRLAVEATDVILDDFIYLHFTIVKGRCLLKDDSSTLLSAKTYAEFIRPVNEKVIRAMRSGGIHWCGNGDQWRDEVVRTQNLVSLDWGNPDQIDLPAWASLLRERRLPVVRMEWSAPAFLASAPTRLFPTGAAFTVMLEDVEQAEEILRQGAGSQETGVGSSNAQPNRHNGPC
jgi:hypothetical protein